MEAEVQVQVQVMENAGKEQQWFYKEFPMSFINYLKYLLYTWRA